MERKSSWGRVASAVVFGLAIVAVGSILTGTAEAQQGRRGGGQRGGMDMTRMMYLEFTWAAVNFGCDMSTEKIAKLKPTYQAVYDKRQKVRAEAMQTRNFQTMMTSLDETNKEIGAALTKELTEEEIAGLVTWQKSLTALTALLAGGQQQGGRGRMGNAMYLERAWAMISFGMKATDEQIAKLAPTFKEHSQLRADAVEGGNADLCTAVVDDAKADIDATVKEAVTEEQWKLYEDQVSNRRRGGPGGGNRGGNRGPGGPAGGGG